MTIFFIYEEELGSELGSGSEVGNLFAQEGGLTCTCSPIIYRREYLAQLVV